MKKLAILVLALLVLSAIPSAFAACTGCAAAAAAIQERAQARNMTGEHIEERLKAANMTAEEARERIQEGLTNALTRVRNERAREVLQRNLDRWMERYQARLQRFENVTVEDVDNETGAAVIRARQKVRFFGFIKGRATKRFNINAQGKIEEKAPWYRFMYAEEPEEETAEE
ncbi:hypothetical protein KY332_01110 [Candidatus Woesearchaeota archaeon]|nr:hypothetical protein [Candidatus Woesearchaeota archaeon]